VKQREQMLKEVKNIFLSSKNDIKQQLNLIDSLQRLGISYHFESEIDETLEQIYNFFTSNKDMTPREEGLHFLALAFRLLRQKGHHISSGRYKQIFLAYFLFCFKEFAPMKLATKLVHTRCKEVKSSAKKSKLGFKPQNFRSIFFRSILWIKIDLSNFLNIHGFC
jgi:hypothetical protein